MKIVNVIPLSKGIWRESLSYFTSQEVSLGSLVSVPVKNKMIDGLVVAEKEVKDLKTQIKKTDFSWRKINRVKKDGYFPPEFIKAANLTAEYYAAFTGQVIKSLIPQIILDKLPDAKSPDWEDPREKIMAEILAVQEPDEERLSFYKSLIRESFAKKQSVFLCLPTWPDIERVIPLISKGIEQYVITLHGNLAKNQLVGLWKKVLTTPHPILIIATPLFLSLPRADITTLIFEKENSSTYKNFSRPYVDWRFFAEKLAEQKKIRLIFGDIALRSETIYRLGREEIMPAGAIKYRVYSDIKQQLWPLVKKDKKDDYDILNSLGERLLAQIENAGDSNEHFFILAGQRGLTPITICNDCGLVMACDICHSVLVIHQKTKSRSLVSANENLFLCHKCGQIVEIEDKCPHCHGNRLALLGLGTEKIEEEIRAHSPKTNIFRLDSDSAKTSAKAKEIVARFYASPGSVLVGTEMALNYLSEKIENIGIVGLDGLFTKPDYRLGEKLFSELLRLRLLASKRLFIQTRNPHEKVFTYVLSGNLLDFYRDEIEERRELGYPPFKILIKVSREGKKDDIKKDMAQAEKSLAEWNPISYPSLGKNIKGLPILNILIKLPTASWPNKKLLAILKSLPPSFIIRVDPESVL
jgi:primosomal protein N' (replication factor Y)